MADHEPPRLVILHFSSNDHSTEHYYYCLYLSFSLIIMLNVSSDVSTTSSFHINFHCAYICLSHETHSVSLFTSFLLCKTSFILLRSRFPGSAVEIGHIFLCTYYPKICQSDSLQQIYQLLRHYSNKEQIFVSFE